jgi:hypothetical protein
MNASPDAEAFRRKEMSWVMAKDNSADLMQALITKLYATITGNDGNIKMPRNKFVTWMSPGVPFSPRDFFCPYVHAGRHHLRLQGRVELHQRTQQ